MTIDFQKQNSLIHKLINRHIDTDQSTRNSFCVLLIYLMHLTVAQCTIKAAFKKQTKMIDKLKQTLAMKSIHSKFK